MAGPGLSTTRTTANTAAEHVSDHNIAHGVLNKFDTATPANGDVLKWNGSTWAPGTDNVSAPGTSPFGAKRVNVQSKGAVGNGTTDDTAAINQAITDAGSYGTVYFPATTAYYRVLSSLKPLAGQTWIGETATRYGWDASVTSGSIIRASSTFTGPAVIYNDPAKVHGVGTGTGVSWGVELRNLGIFGAGEPGETGTLDGIDFGPFAGRERGWKVYDCQLMYLSTALAGHQWVVTVRGCHISRCGWGLAPFRGVDPLARAFDSLYMENYFYFNLHHAVELGGGDATRPNGMVTLAHNRFERSGTQVSGNTVSPNANRDETACGILISTGTAVLLNGNTTDSNAGPGLKIDAPAKGNVNNVTSQGNTWKRDGSGNNLDSITPGAYIQGAEYSTFRDRITFGDPDDGGPGYSSPQRGVWTGNNGYCSWDGGVQLGTGLNTQANAYGLIAGAPASISSQIRDPRWTAQTTMP